MILPTHTHIIQLYTLILLEAIEACFVVLDGNRGDVAVQMRAEEEMPMEAEQARKLGRCDSSLQNLKTFLTD